MNFQNFSSATFTAQNIGGLSHIKTTIGPGLNIIEEPNASGKTSFLRAFTLLVTPSGSHKELDYMLKFNTKEGKVTISDQNGTSFEKNIFRNRNTIMVEGEDYITPEISDLVRKFAIGGNDNEILTAIRNGLPLKEILTNDFNTQKTKQEIKKLEEDLEKLEREIRALEGETTKRAGLITLKNKLEDSLESLEANKNRIDNELSKISNNIEDNVAKEQYNEITKDISEKEIKIQETTRLINDSRQRINAYEREILKINDTLKKLEGKANIEISSLKNEISRLSSAVQPAKKDLDVINLFISSTGQIIRNIESLHAANTHHNHSILDSLSSSGISEKDIIQCPCCRQETRKETLSNTLEEYKQLAATLKEDINTKTKNIEALEEERKTLQEQEAKRNDLITTVKSREHDIYNIRDQIVSRQKALDNLSEEKKDLESKLQTISINIDSNYQDLYTKLEKVNQNIGKDTKTLENVQQSILLAEDANEKLQQEKENEKALTKEINQLKSDLQHKEERLLDLFNATIKEVYSKLNFNTNVYEIVLDPDTFEVKVSRYSEKGQPTIDSLSTKTLSKSELEVIGLVVMLSGYIINDLKTFFPFIILDELTFLDNKRLKDLMEFMEEYTTSIILTKLPTEQGPTGNSKIKIVNY
jgi:DNA repair exonuclease SbcCD ATPase subunit